MSRFALLQRELRALFDAAARAEAAVRAAPREAVVAGRLEAIVVPGFPLDGSAPFWWHQPSLLGFSEFESGIRWLNVTNRLDKEVGSITCSPT